MSKVWSSWSDQREVQTWKKVFKQHLFLNHHLWVKTIERTFLLILLWIQKCCLCKTVSLIPNFIIIICHVLILRESWTFWCLFKWCPLANALSHLSHGWGLSLKWTAFICLFKWLPLVKALSHLWHRCGLSSKWTAFICLFKCSLLANALSHFWHGWGLSL